MVLAKLKDSTVEIKDVDDLFRVLKEVRNSEEPLVIRDNGAEIVVPASHRPKRRRMSPEERAKADEEAFLLALGGWKDHIDPDEFMKQVRAGRSSNRPVYEITLPEE